MVSRPILYASDVAAAMRGDTKWQLAHNFQDVQRDKILVIAGPTASGKSRLALSIAPKLKGEIISADSMQVYRGMDVGTAKVSAEERALVPHHLLDVRDVSDPMTVVDYYYQAKEVIKGILARNRVPIVVGGSGFYIHTLLYGPPPGPPSVKELRQRLEEEEDKFGIHALYDRLQKLDPEYAETVTCRDRQKIIRALEIISLSDRKVSDLKWRTRNRPLEYDYACWFIHWPKEILKVRIHERCKEMLAAGLVDEVRALCQSGLDLNTSAKNAIGYRQAWEHLAQEPQERKEENLLERLDIATRRYAKRQMTWFRKESLFRWLDLGLYDEETAQDMIVQDFEARL